jgi:hypothetical protein
MKHLLLILLVMLLTLPMVSCNDTSGPEATQNNQSNQTDDKDEDRRQIVKFTLVKAVEYGDCDGWKCEATSDSGSDFEGYVYVQVEGLSRHELWDVGWGNASGTKTLNKSKEYNIPKGTKITLFSEGLYESDNWTNKDEGISEFSKEFYYPIKDYDDMTFDCLHGTWGSGCYCCITFHFKIEAEFIDPEE